jgi:hypothetical protein
MSDELYFDDDGRPIPPCDGDEAVNAACDGEESAPPPGTDAETLARMLDFILFGDDATRSRLNPGSSFARAFLLARMMRHPCVAKMKNCELAEVLGIHESNVSKLFTKAKVQLKRLELGQS